jgi:ATPase subunit of ABC transporter with duplicated ATPase domains
MLELQKKSNLKKEDQIKKLETFIARFSANAARSSQATARRKSLDKISIDEIKPSTRRYPYINFDLNREVGKQLLNVDNISYVDEKGKTLFANLSFRIEKHEKVALLGINDIAKTKLLEILAGITKPTTGTVQ